MPELEQDTKATKAVPSRAEHRRALYFLFAGLSFPRFSVYCGGTYV